MVIARIYICTFTCIRIRLCMCMCALTCRVAVLACCRNAPVSESASKGEKPGMINNVA